MLLLAGRNKPAVVWLLDINRLDHERFRSIPLETPPRNERILLDFSVDPKDKKQREDAETVDGHDSCGDVGGSEDKKEKADAHIDQTIRMPLQGPEVGPFSVADLVKKIDQKIAELEAEEQEEKERDREDNLSDIVKQVLNEIDECEKKERSSRIGNKTNGLAARFAKFVAQKMGKEE